MNIKKKIKKGVVNALAFHDVSNGFSVRGARRWVRSTYRCYTKNNDYTFKEKRWAIKHGFLPEQVEMLQLENENIADAISYKDYEYVHPLNGTYSKWLADRVTVQNIFKPYRDKMPRYFYQISKRYKETNIIPLNKTCGDTMEDVLQTIREQKRVRVLMSKARKGSLVEWKKKQFWLDGKAITEEALRQVLVSKKTDLVIAEELKSRADYRGIRINMIVFNEQGDNPVIGDAYMLCAGKEIFKSSIFNYEEENEQKPITDVEENLEVGNHALYARIDVSTGKVLEGVLLNGKERSSCNINFNTGNALPEVVEYWDEMKEIIDSICRFAPQLEFIGFQFMICEDGVKIVKMMNHPTYPKVIPFGKETSEYLKRKVEQKREAYKGVGEKVKRGCNKIKLKVRSTYAKMFFPKGMLPYLTIKFPKEVRKDFFTNKDTTLKEKIWAIKHGFISYRIHQYGIDDSNFNQFISDFEYRWLRHINGKNRVWMEDKITVKYICSEYNDCFPAYYYHISLKNGNNKVISLMDCPKDYTNTYEDIFRLVKEKGCLALKPDEGSHGDGFYKFSYHDGEYFLNHAKATEQDVLNILKDVKNQYLVTEYIDMHPIIKNIYSGSVNTIRMIVFKKDGKTPEIGNAYMRFGSKRTGAVDNMGAGGMFAKIDIDTGKFYDAKIIEANEIKSCLYHPDTNVKIEGYLPNWDKVKENVLNVAKSIPQLEYFGFDLAITEDGLKFPEINRFPDYPAIEKLSPKTMDYLLYKLEKKKELYGGKDFRGNSIIKLPKR